MNLSDELSWRGLIKDKTFEDLNWLNEPKTFYLGVDCSSNSLTIGNLAILLLAKRLVKSGWKAVLLVGGATSLIGDPGGKDEERELKSPDEIAKNVSAIKAQVAKLFEGFSFKPVDNYDWFKDIGYLEFLRDVGKHYSMTELMQRDFIVSRMGDGGSGISYAEFSYSLIQGYDFWYLYKTEGAVLQIGGSDQWGNMLSGVPLVRKKEKNAQVHALSIPLVIDKLTGKKFGKSEYGAIWLDKNRTSPYNFYQFWLNVDDDAVEEFLKIYTELGKQEVENIITEFNQDKSQRIAQKNLAFEVTKLIHGEEEAKKQQNFAKVLFETRDFKSFSASDFEALESELPFVSVSEGTSYSEALVQTNLASSLSESRRLIEQGALSNSNLFIVTPSKDKIVKNEALEGYMVLIKGKKNLALIKIN